MYTHFYESFLVLKYIGLGFLEREVGLRISLPFTIILDVSVSVASG